MNQVRVSLVDTTPAHHVLNHVLCADEAAAAPFAAAFQALKSTRDGATEVVCTALPHPAAVTL